MQQSEERSGGLVPIRPAWRKPTGRSGWRSGHWPSRRGQSRYRHRDSRRRRQAAAISAPFRHGVSADWRQYPENSCQDAGCRGSRKAPYATPQTRRGLIWIKPSASSRESNQYAIRQRVGENATMGTVRWIISTAPEIFLLLAVAIGTILGRVKIRGFAIGTTACILIVAVLIGPFRPFTFPPMLRGVLFRLFVFTIGYRSGPEFFASLSVRTLAQV